MDFMVFICGVRAKVSQELNRCLLERFKQKYKVGEASSYEVNEKGERKKERKRRCYFKEAW